MPRTHIVEAGECLATIARRYHLSGWRSLYEHPNNAELRALRPNPNVILPGDRVIVPDAKSRTIAVTTDAVHKFRVSAEKTFLRLDLCDAAGGVPVGSAYELHFDGIRDPVKGTLGDDGKLDVEVPLAVGRAELRLLDGEGAAVRHVMHLYLGFIDPHEELSGIQERLRRIGFNCVDERTLGPSTRSALACFQRAFDLPADGQPNAGTVEKLRQLAGV